MVPSIFDEICYTYSASVDIRPLPGAWVAELLGVVLGVQDHKNIKFPMALKGLKTRYDKLKYITIGCKMC